MRALTILTAVAAVAATSFGAVAVSAGAADDDVLLTGRVVDRNGNPLQGIAVTCRTERYYEYLQTGTDADGTYSFTRADLPRIDPSKPETGCQPLRFLDPKGLHATTTWPSGDGRDPGERVNFPPEGGEPAVANITLDAGGQVAGSATDAKRRGLFNVRVEVYAAATRKRVAIVHTSPYGGYRVLGLRPGPYKIKIGTGGANTGYRPVYAGSGSTIGAAKTFTVRAGATTALGRRTLPNTGKLFASRGAVNLTYPRPLVAGSKVTVSKSAYTSTPSTGTTIFIASRAVNPATGEPDDTLPYASSFWDIRDNYRSPIVVRGDDDGPGAVFLPFAGRRFVVIAVHKRNGYARTTIVSAPTAISQ